MTETLVSYLLQHKSISIPGLGSMYIERIPAQTDFVNKRILPPDYHFRFDKYFDAPDKDFFTYLALQHNIADYEAIKWYNEWAYDLRNRIRDGEVVKWNGIGALKKDASGEVIFESAGAIHTLQQPAPALRVIHSHAQHTMIVGDQEVTREIAMPGESEYPEELVTEKKDNWWIYVIVLAVLAIIVIIIRFYYSGFTTGATGNHQTIGN
jgi:hypothetical protein